MFKAAHKAIEINRTAPTFISVEFSSFLSLWTRFKAEVSISRPWLLCKVSRPANILHDIVTTSICGHFPSWNRVRCVFQNVFYVTF